MDRTTPAENNPSQPRQTRRGDATLDTHRMPYPPVAASAHAYLASRDNAITEWLGTLSPRPDQQPSKRHHRRDHKLTHD
jgi:hypothetical protein